jgi:ABC-type sugar transport system ATPase subunit
MGEFGATITFVSNIPGETQTLPSAIYTFTQVPGGDAGAMRLTLVSIAISIDGADSPRIFARRVSRPHADRMSLQSSVRKHRLGAFDARCRLRLRRRLHRALFGPLRLGQDLAGQRHLRPDRGRMTAASSSMGASWSIRAMRLRAAASPPHRLCLPGSAAVPAPDRRSEPPLYGRWFSPESERYAEFDAVVDLLGIGHLLQRRPASLSGGEKQRVAIGRALTREPRGSS